MSTIIVLTSDSHRNCKGQMAFILCTCQIILSLRRLLLLFPLNTGKGRGLQWSQLTTLMKI